jgi:type II secretion system protein G
MRMTFCALLVVLLAALGSAHAQTSDAELAILRAREAGSSLKVRELEEKIHELERNEKRNQPLYGFDDLVFNPMLANRREMEQIKSAKAVNSFLKELDVAEKQGTKGKYLVLKIIQLSEQHPNALTDPTVKNLVDLATVEAQAFLIAHREKKIEERAQDDFRTIAGQLRIYQSENGSLPTYEQGIGALVNNPTGVPAPNNWRQLLQRIPLDPWGEPYVYRPDGNEFQIASKGRDREEGNEDDLVFDSSTQE